MKITEDYKFSKGDHRAESSFFNKENVKKVNTFLGKIKNIAKEKKVTLGQLVINWTIQKDGITAALVGARDPKQAEENAKACDFMLSKEEIDIIDKFLSEINFKV